jgi:hypothetical protein
MNPEPEFQKSRIERLKSALYSRNDKIVPKEKRTPVRGESADVPTDWGERPSFEFSLEEMKKKNNSFFNKFLVASVLFFILAIGVSAFMFFGGWNMISSNNVDIRIIAPTSISSGEQLDLGLSIVNQNRTDLDNVSLIITYPDGSRNTDGDSQALTREQVNIGLITKGGSKDHSIRAILFGEKGVVKSFNFRVEYRVKGSNAIFSKEKSYDVVIGSSPILLEVSYPKEVNSGQEITLSLDITSNSTVVMKDTMVKVEYPYGFTYKSSSIKPLRDLTTQTSYSVWNISDLKNGDKKNLKVTGVLVGQNMEDRSFRISVGTADLENNEDFSTDLAVSQVTIGIRRPFFDLSVKSQGNNLISIGELSTVMIGWKNTLPDKVINNRIEAVISGNIFDNTRVFGNHGGFYRSLNNSITWDKNTTESLSELSPSQSGQVTFSVGSINNQLQIRSTKNPHINIKVTMTGDRSGSNAETVSSSKEIVIKMESALDISSQSHRNIGPFTNTGPIPPRADNETTYTVTWTVTNTTNDLTEAVASATLPVWAVWKGETSPTSERIAYDPDNRVVTWNIGNVSFGTGYTYSPKEVSFKVGVTPNLTQVGQSLNIISATSISAKDTYTETILKSSDEAVGTRFSDPGFRDDDGVIVR